MRKETRPLVSEVADVSSLKGKVFVLVGQPTDDVKRVAAAKKA